MLGQAWVLPTYSDDNFPGADDLVLKILKARGVENADRFLNPSIKEYMPNPSVLSVLQFPCSSYLSFAGLGKNTLQTTSASGEKKQC